MQSAIDLWPLFSSVEAESVVNALRRWQSSVVVMNYERKKSRSNAPTVNDPYVRLILDRCLPPAGNVMPICHAHVDALMVLLACSRGQPVPATVGPPSAIRHCGAHRGD